LNPFGAAGTKQDDPRDVSRCGFCKQPYGHDAQTVRTLCTLCSTHYAVTDQPVERALTRARSHEEIAYDYARRAKARAARVELDVREVRRQVASALKARGRWRSLAISMVEAHTPVGKDKCKCGTKSSTKHST
jgi:hypothetical protein